jgi:predicted nucleotidyltransferase
MRETTEASDIRALVSRFVAMAKERFPIEEAWFFGSWAYGNPRDESDVDIGLIMPDGFAMEEESQLFSAALDFDARLEVHTFSRTRFDTERRQIFRDIKQKGIRIA